MGTASACAVGKTRLRRRRIQLEREFGESAAEVAGMSDTELRAYLDVLWLRRARDTAGGGAG